MQGEFSRSPSWLVITNPVTISAMTKRGRPTTRSTERNPNNIRALREKREKLIKQRQRIDAELAKIDHAEKIYRESGVSGGDHSEIAQNVGSGESEQISEQFSEQIGNQSAAPPTIKDVIKVVLSKTPQGLTSEQLYLAVKRHLPNLGRSSFSPQLSRLRGEGLVNRENQLWVLRQSGAETLIENASAPVSPGGTPGEDKP